MPTSYTTLLGLALPVTGELSGTWGDVVSNYITQYVDSAVAGTQTISGSQTAVTLSVTNGSSLVTAGSGATGSAQFQIINCTGNPAGLLTITAPASSRQYIIINATSTSQSVKIVGVGPTTGVTILSGEKAHVAWNGSDFVKIATQNGNGDFVTVDTTNLEVTNIKAKDGTAAASIADSTGVVTFVKDQVVNGITVGRGAGAVSTNTAVGASALAANTTGQYNTAVGTGALQVNTTGQYNTAIGALSLTTVTTGSSNSGFGLNTLRLTTTGSNNTAVGQDALFYNTTASNNTAVGYQAGYANTTGAYITAFGWRSLYTNTTGENTALGAGTLYFNTTGTANTAVGGTTTSVSGALTSNTTGNYNTSVGVGSLAANTTASNNTAVGYQAGYTNTTGAQLTAIGTNAGRGNTTGADNSFVGYSAGYSNSTGSYNTALGKEALAYNTTASYNTAVGYQAGYSNTTGTGNLFLGFSAGLATTTGDYNTLVGRSAGLALTTGSSNTFVGGYDPSTGGSGAEITTGSNNTILGPYNGNQGGLDIRTASNYIVLSDGDGNPLVFTANNNTFALQGGTISSGTGIAFPATQSASSNANTLDDYEEGTWTPTDASGAGLSLTVTGAFYTKVGNLVTCWFELAYPSTSSSASSAIGGLPFATKNVSTYRWSCGAGYNNKSINDLTMYGSYNSSQFNFYVSNGNVVLNSSLSNGLLTCTFSYQSA